MIALATLFSFTACAGFGIGGQKRVDGKTVTVVYEADKIDYWTDIKNGYETQYAEQGYTLNLIPVGGGQVQDKQQTMIAQNDAPDLILGGDVHIGNQFKYLLPLDELLARDDAEVDAADFISAVLDKCKRDGKTYYLPEFFNVSLLYYNKDIFDAFNATPANADRLVEYPQADWTYEEFYDTADKLTVRSGGAVSKFGCYSTIGWWGEWLIHVRQAGGEFMKDGYVDLNTTAAKAGLQRYYDKMFAANRISNKPGIDETFGDFSTKNYAMDYGGHISNWSIFRGIKGLDWDVQLLPAVNGNHAGGELAVSAYGIYKNSKSVEATWALIKYMTRKRSFEEWNAYPYPPCRTSGKELLLAVPKAERPAPQNLEAAYESLENGYCKSLPSEKYFTYVNLTIVQNYVTKILEGEYNVSDGLDEATKRANDYIRQNYMS